MVQLFKKQIKEVVILGSPLLASNILNFSVGFVDTLMVSRLGVADLNAISIADSFFSILMMICWPIVLISQSRFTQGTPKSSSSMARDISTSTIVFLGSVIVGILVFAASFFLQSYVFLGIAESTADLAKSYLNLIRFTLFTMVVEYALTGYFFARKNTKLVMRVKIFGNLSNVVLNYVFIYGYLFFPQLGIVGAAMGTLLSRVFMLILYLTYYFREQFSTSGLKIRIGYSNLSSEIGGYLIKLLPLSLQNGLGYFVLLFYKLQIGSIDGNLLAVTHIVLIIFTVNKMLVKGYAQSGSILVGHAIQISDTKSAFGYVKSTLGISTVIGLIVILLILLFPTQLIGLFTSEGELVSWGVKALFFFSISFLIEIMVHPLEIILSANGFGRNVLIAESVPMIFFNVIAVYLINRFIVAEYKIFLLWGCFSVYQFVFAISLLYLIRPDKFKTKEI